MDRPPQKREIAARFRALRRRALLSQSDLGRIISFCRQSVSEVESGRVMPHEATWRRFRALEAKHQQRKIILPTKWA